MFRRMVGLGRVSRSSFYRSQEDKPTPPDGDMDLRDAIHRIAVKWPCYGRPRITKELREHGWKVNAKRVYRLMRQDNLLCLRKRKFVVTTDSNHGRKIYPNLAAKIASTGVSQLWVADITYVRLEEEFIFVAVILDAYSRRVIGWAMDRNMEDELTLTALRMALAERGAPPGRFTIRIAARNTPATITPGCFTKMASPSACRAKATRGTTRFANRS